MEDSSKQKFGDILHQNTENAKELVTHRCEKHLKENVYPKLLNESLEGKSSFTLWHSDEESKILFENLETVQKIIEEDGIKYSMKLSLQEQEPERIVLSW
jgi:hypothetical protein